MSDPPDDDHPPGTDDPTSPEHEEGHEDHTLENVKHGTEAGLELAKGVGELAHGDGAGGASSLLKGAGGALEMAGHLVDDEEAQQALEVAGTVAELAGEAVEVGHEIFGGGHGSGHGGGHGAGGHGAGGHGAGSATGHAQQALGGHGSEEAGHGAEIIGHGDEALRAATEGHGSAEQHLVSFHLEVADFEEHWGVHHISLNEGLNQLPRGSIEARYAGHVEASELLHKEVKISIERPNQRREFKGIVWHARTGGHGVEEETTVHLVVMPAMAYLQERFDSHIYPDKTVVEVIEAVYAEMCGGLSRTVDTENLQRTYETREYIVQYQESHFDFLSRLTEEEGIFWFFDHEGDNEVLTLADAVGGLPQAREDDEGKAPYHEHAQQAPEHESVYAMRHTESVGATDIVVSEHDWTRPDTPFRGEQTGRSEHEPALEVHDHTDALIFHDYSDPSYGGDTASVQAQLRAERLDLDRQRWELSTTVVTAYPGRTLEVEGAPDAALDQRYLIVSSSSQGRATAGGKAAGATRSMSSRQLCRTARRGGRRDPLSRVRSWPRSSGRARSTPTNGAG